MLVKHAFAMAFLVFLSATVQVQAADLPAPDPGDTLDLGALMQPLGQDGVFRLPDYHCWCPNILKGGDGKYYLVYSRWPKSSGVDGWLTHSEAALAVSDKAEGPYRHLQVLLRGRGPGHWDENMVHNPKLEKFNSKYYLYYISSRKLPTRGEIRHSQRTGVAVADTLLGPYRPSDQPIVEPAAPVFNLTVNPTVAAMPDGRYLMILKGDAHPKKPTEPIRQRILGLAIADSPEGPFRILPQTALANLDTEDADLWRDPVRERFYALFHAFTHIGLLTSPDGFTWRPARHHTVTKKAIPCADGTIMRVARLERPDLFMENGRPRILCLGAAIGPEFFCILVPLRQPAVTPPLGSNTSPDFSGVTAAMRQCVDNRDMSGAVTIVAAKDDLLHCQAIGWADSQCKVPMTTNSLFWIASMTKPVTAVALLMLQDEGKLKITDPVAKYIPQFAGLKTPSGKPANLTIAQLMTHTSGLGEAPWEAAGNARALADLIPLFLAAPMQFEPGTKWKYCQSSINVASRIVEIVSGLSFDRFLQEGFLIRLA